MAKKSPKKKKRAQRRVSAKEILIFAALGLAAILIAGLAHLAGLDGNRAETALRMSEVMSANTATALPGAAFTGQTAPGSRAAHRPRRWRGRCAWPPA